MKLQSIRCPGCCRKKQLSMVFTGDCSTVRQPRVQEVNSGEDDAYYAKFCQRAARRLYHRVLERTGGLVSKIYISCCATGTHRFALVDQSWLSTTHIRCLGESNRPENGKQSTVIQAMSVENPQSILCLSDLMTSQTSSNIDRVFVIITPSILTVVTRTLSMSAIGGGGETRRCRAASWWLCPGWILSRQ